jgi:hypothetical protein
MKEIGAESVELGFRSQPVNVWQCGLQVVSAGIKRVHAQSQPSSCMQEFLADVPARSGNGQ